MADGVPVPARTALERRPRHPSSPIQPEQRRSRATDQPAGPTASRVAAALLALAEQFDFGIVVLGDSARVEYSNGHARRLLTPRPDLMLRRGTLTSTEPRLAALIAGKAAARVRRSHWTMEIGADSARLVIDHPALQRSSDPDVLVLYTPRQSRAVSIPLLRDIYGLTNAEALLAAQLSCGSDLAGAARALGISIHTVRTHLKKIFGKLEVRSQVELVTLLLAGPRLSR